MVKKRQGKVECGDEVDHLLLDLALAKFGRTEDTITDHRDIVFVWISVFFSFFSALSLYCSPIASLLLQILDPLRNLLLNLLSVR